MAKEKEVHSLRASGLAKKVLMPAKHAREVCFNVSTGIPNSLHAENLKAMTLFC